MYGLVLQGGGAKGSYHIGVWKALREFGVQISAVTGTSVGALNGAFVAQDDFDRAFELWENMSTEMVFNASDKVHEFFQEFEFDHTDFEDYIKIFRKKNLEAYPAVFSEILHNKGLDITPLRNLIDSLLDEDKIRSGKCDFGLVTINLSDLKAMELFIEDIPKGKLTDYLLASSFLPVFKFQKLDGKRFIDGGFYDNLPVDMMADRGYKKIITSEIQFGIIRDIITAKKVDRDDAEITRVMASEDLGGILQFESNTARKNIEIGYNDTIRTFKNKI